MNSSTATAEETCRRRKRATLKSAVVSGAPHGNVGGESSLRVYGRCRVTATYRTPVCMPALARDEDDFHAI